MRLILNIIVLIFEILYYSLFMKYARREGKFWKYLILFILFSIITIFVDKRFFINYVLIFLFILYGIKYIVNLKITLYDLLFIIIMFISKLIIETPMSICAYILFKNIYISAIIVSFIKISTLFIINKKFKISIIYSKLQKLWNNNNFYIRYVFSILMFIYVIFSCAFLIIEWI